MLTLGFGFSAQVYQLKVRELCLRSVQRPAVGVHSSAFEREPFSGDPAHDTK